MTEDCSYTQQKRPRMLVSCLWPSSCSVAWGSKQSSFEKLTRKEPNVRLKAFRVRGLAFRVYKV